MILILAPAVAALSAVIGILVGLADPIRPPEARRTWALAGTGLACLSLGLVIAALAVAAGAPR